MDVHQWTFGMSLNVPIFQSQDFCVILNRKNEEKEFKKYTEEIEKCRKVYKDLVFSMIYQKFLMSITSVQPHSNTRFLMLPQ